VAGRFCPTLWSWLSLSLLIDAFPRWEPVEVPHVALASGGELVRERGKEELAAEAATGRWTGNLSRLRSAVVGLVQAKQDRQEHRPRTASRCCPGWRAAAFSPPRTG